MLIELIHSVRGTQMSGLALKRTRLGGRRLSGELAIGLARLTCGTSPQAPEQNAVSPILYDFCCFSPILQGFCSTVVERLTSWEARRGCRCAAYGAELSSRTRDACYEDCCSAGNSTSGKGCVFLVICTSPSSSTNRSGLTGAGRR